MSVRRHGLCALGLVVLLLGGCKSGDFDFSLGFLQSTGTPGGDRVVAGSLETVSQSTQDTLSRLGMAASVTKDGEGVYIASTTPSGAKFKLVLTRVKLKNVEPSEQTRVRVEWEGRSDEQTVFQLLAGLDSTSRR
jgi:hypothetical protein